MGFGMILVELQLGYFLFPMIVMHSYSFCYCFTKGSLYLFSQPYFRKCITSFFLFFFFMWKYMCGWGGGGEGKGVGKWEGGAF